MVRFVGRSAVKFQQNKKYDKKLYDKNNTAKNQQSAKQYKKYDKTFVYYRVRCYISSPDEKKIQLKNEPKTLKRTDFYNHR